MVSKSGPDIHLRQDVIQSLRVGKSQRSDRDIQTIMDFIRTNCRANIFRQISQEALSKLCRGITLDEYKPDQVIIRQGSVSDFMLILIKGKVDVFRNESGSGSIIGKLIISLSRPGDFVGEMGLVENAPRNSTVVATYPTWCMKIDGSRSRSVVKKQLRSEQVAKMQKIAALSYFDAGNEANSEAFIRELSHTFKSQTLRVRDILFKEGAIAEEVSFVISGSIGLRRRNQNGGNPLQPHVLVCLAGVGEIIGGEALDPLLSEPRYQFSAIAESRVELLTLTRAAARILDRNLCRDRIWNLFQIRQGARLEAVADSRRLTGIALNNLLTTQKSGNSKHRKPSHTTLTLDQELLRLPTSNVGLRFAPNAPCHRCRANITGIRPLSNRRLIPLIFTDGHFEEWHAKAAPTRYREHSSPCSE